MFRSSFSSFHLNFIFVVVILLQILPRGGKVVLPGVSSAAEESLRAEVCHYETFEVNCTQLMKSSLTQHHHHHHHHQRHRHQEANGNKNGDQNMAETSLSHVIMIEKSKYGRMQLGRCATKDYGHVGCHHDVTDHTTGLCSGLEACRIHVPDEWLKALQPCPKDFASFLEISYKCLPVAVASKANSCSGHVIVDVNRRPIPEGYLASHVTQTTNHGSKNCPWLVRASQGQRLTLTLIELVTSSESVFPPYNLDGNKMADKSHVVIHPTESSDMSCLKYAQIRDLSSSEEGTKVCGSKEGRNRVVYTSKGHLVEVTILPQARDKTGPRFLLHYKAIGCPMLSTPSNGWLEQDGKDVFVSGCNSTNEKRVHRCHGNQWSNPDVITCPDAGGTSRSYSWSTNNEEWSSPLGILFVSAIGVSLGLVIGVSLLFVVVVCLKRYRSPGPAIGRNPAIAYDPANQMEDIYQHHHQLGQSQVGHRHQFQLLNQSGYPTQDSNLILRAGDQDSTTKLSSPPKIEIIPLQTPMTYGALWPPGENSLLDVHTRISDRTSSSHALPSTNHKPLLLGHCNCDLDVIATTDAVNRRHFEKGHPYWSSNECSYDYPEVISTNKKSLSEMPGFDLPNQSTRLQ